MKKKSQIDTIFNNQNYYYYLFQHYPHNLNFVKPLDFNSRVKHQRKCSSIFYQNVKLVLSRESHGYILL